MLSFSFLTPTTRLAFRYAFTISLGGFETTPAHPGHIPAVVTVLWWYRGESAEKLSLACTGRGHIANIGMGHILRS